MRIGDSDRALIDAKNAIKIGKMQCCGTGPFISDPDPRIRFKKYRSGSGSYIYLDMFLMFGKLIFFYGIFLPNLNILWHLKSKIKNYLDETVF